MSSKEVKAREELAEYQKKAEDQRKKLEEKVLSLQKDKFQLTDDLEKVKIVEEVYIVDTIKKNLNPQKLL